KLPCQTWAPWLFPSPSPSSQIDDASAAPLPTLPLVHRAVDRCRGRRRTLPHRYLPSLARSHPPPLLAVTAGSSASAAARLHPPPSPPLPGQPLWLTGAASRVEAAAQR
ncbi:Os03g0716900, partial [Oryza sativa Japonica Group]